MGRRFRIFIVVLLFVIYRLFLTVQPLVGTALSKGQLEPTSSGYIEWKLWESFSNYVGPLIFLIIILIMWPEIILLFNKVKSKIKQRNIEG